MSSRTSGLPFTGDPHADQLLVDDPLALLIGMVLDQQVPLEWAFRGPYELRRRLGHLDAPRIAAMKAAALERAFVTQPALHRFPSSMAQRVQALCVLVVRDYRGDAGRIWREAEDGRALTARLRALPGFGEAKVRTLISILGKRLGVRPPGWEREAASGPSLGDVDCPQALDAYREHKRRVKAQVRRMENRPRAASARRFGAKGK